MENVKSFVESKSLDDLKNEVSKYDLSDNHKLKELVIILFSEIFEMQKKK